jgi:2-oxoisovalerate dehydrogenase E1 component
MSAPAKIERLEALSLRFAAFVAERCPFALEAARSAFDAALSSAPPPAAPRDFGPLRERLRRELSRRVPIFDLAAVPETTPRVSAGDRLARARRDLEEDCDGFLARESIARSISKDEKREILRGMLRTRAVDNRLKAFFIAGEVRYEGSTFQGKGFRSLGQEAIYAAPLRLRRGPAYRGQEGDWRGDVVAPLIRDLGAAIAMRPDTETIRMVLASQMGKAGSPMGGKDLHVGDLAWGVLPASAPLGLSSLTVAGFAMAFAREGSGRVAVSFIGEGGSSLGEWHEAITVCAARALPAVFCVQNNQTALSTPAREQSRARVFAEKATGYGIPGITIDGTDPEAIAAAFAWAADRARQGRGPALIELVAMRMCGHAHHDDMLYLGRDPQPSWDYPALSEGAYADKAAFAFWSARDPLRRYAERLDSEGLVDPAHLEQWKREAEEEVEREARAVIDAPWPAPESAGRGVFRDEPARRRDEPLEPGPRLARVEPALPKLEPVSFDPRGRTFLDAVALGIADALRADPRTFVYGEDVGGQYGNAFLLLRPLLPEFGDRILNAPIAEGGIIGVCLGAALAGSRPIGEIQFNDFVASGFDALVNGAAKVRYRWGGEAPFVLRMPWGGLRHAGPYHSQNTESWFYRTPGLKIVVPSTPADARALFRSAVEDPDPVLFYEHIALYRDPRIKQMLAPERPDALPLGRAALRRDGKDLAIVSYGAYVHVALRAAETLAAAGIEACVLDLRSLVPLDREALLAVARRCSRVLIVHEDSRTGGIGESLAAIIGEEAFEFLDAPVRVVGALDTPVPYSPPLEKFFLPSEEEIVRAGRLLVAY